MRRVLAGLAGVGLMIALSLSVLSVAGPVASSASTPVLTGTQYKNARCYPLKAGNLTVSKSRIQAGAKVTVVGSNFAGRAILHLRLEPTNHLLAVIHVGNGGNFSVVVRIPVWVKPGRYHLVLKERGCTGTRFEKFSVVIQVFGASHGAVPPPHGHLPFTGANVELPVGLGSVLVLVGVSALAYSRRRPRSSGSSSS